VAAAIVDGPLAGASEAVRVHHVFFMTPAEQKILGQRINDLPFSEDFKKVSNKLGFHTIEQMANIPVTELLNLEGYTYHILQEFAEFMQQNDLYKYLRHR